MIVMLFFNKIKSFTLVFVNLFRRALCCFRRRRRNSCDSVLLTHVISNNEEHNDETQYWENWEDDSLNKQPKTVQDHIDLYRKQTQIAKAIQEPPDFEENIFQDMAPTITKQTKVLINSNHVGSTNTSRLNFMEESMNAVPSSELREWEDDSGWEDGTLDHDAQIALREKKRQDRERRLLEQHQKRNEKMSRSLGSRLST